MKKETKRQHFVPRTFLKHFCNNNGKLTGLNKDYPENQIEVSLSNICLQNHLYTIDFENSEKEERQFLENFYCKYFEKDYNEIFEILTDDSVKQISKTLKSKIIETVNSMYWRVAKWLNKSKETQKVALEKLIEVSKKLNNPIVKLGNGNTMDISGKTVDDLLIEFEPNRKFGFIVKQLEGITEFAKKRLNDNISIFRTFGDHQFLTSDNPIVLNNGEERLVDRIDTSCHIMLNISPTHCLTIMPPNREEYLFINRSIMSENYSFMYTGINNDHQFRNCERFVLGTKEGINFYLGNKEIYNSEKKVDELRKKLELELKEEREFVRIFKLINSSNNII